MPKTITAFGETLTLSEWAARTGLKRRILETRLEQTDWSGEQILTTPKFTRMLTKERDGVRVERLVDPVTPWKRDDRCWYVVAHHPDGLTLEQVGSLIGVTRERVRQIEAVAFDKLKEDPESFQALLRMLRESQDMESRRGEDRGREVWERTVHDVHALPPTRHEREEAEMARTITHDGETMLVGEWAERLGMKWQVLSARRRHGWTDEEIVTCGVDERPARFADRKGRLARAKSKRKRKTNGAPVDPPPPPPPPLDVDPPPPADLGEPAEDERRYPLALRVDRERIEHRFPLRPDLVVSVELPADLSIGEAERMSRWLAALAFRDVAE